MKDRWFAKSHFRYISTIRKAMMMKRTTTLQDYQRPSERGFLRPVKVSKFKAFGLVEYMVWVGDDRHQPGKKHCCQEYFAGDGDWIVFGFNSVDEAVLWKARQHMSPVYVYEDADLVATFAERLAYQREVDRVAAIAKPTYDRANELTDAFMMRINWLAPEIGS